MPANIKKAAQIPSMAATLPSDKNNVAPNQSDMQAPNQWQALQLDSDARLAEMGISIEAVQREPAAPVTETGLRHLPLINAATYIETAPPPAYPVLVNFFDRGDKVAVIGQSKLKKTWLAAELAINLASGTKFLSWECVKPLRVLFVQLEVQAAHFHRRIKYCAKGMQIKPSALGDRFAVLNGRGLGVTAEDLHQAAVDHQADVVIVDPTYKLMEGDENAAESWKPILAAFDAICEETGATLIYVLHDKKGGVSNTGAVDRASGSGIVGRDYDAAILLSPHQEGGEFRVIDTVKRNYKDEDAFTVEWVGGSFVKSDLDPVIASGRTARVSKKPVEGYLPEVAGTFKMQSDLSLNKTRLVILFQDKLGLSREKSKELIERAVESDILFTNDGKGLRHKQVIFALKSADIVSEIRRLNRKSNHQEQLPVLPTPNSTRQTGASE